METIYNSTKTDVGLRCQNFGPPALPVDFTIFFTAFSLERNSANGKENINLRMKRAN